MSRQRSSLLAPWFLRPCPSSLPSPMFLPQLCGPRNCMACGHETQQSAAGNRAKLTRCWTELWKHRLEALGSGYTPTLLKTQPESSSDRGRGGLGNSGINFMQLNMLILLYKSQKIPFFMALQEAHFHLHQVRTWRTPTDNRTVMR